MWSTNPRCLLQLWKRRNKLLSSVPSRLRFLQPELLQLFLLQLFLHRPTIPPPRDPRRIERRTRTRTTTPTTPVRLITPLKAKQRSRLFNLGGASDVFPCFTLTATLGSLEFSLLYDQENHALHCCIAKAKVGTGETWSEMRTGRRRSDETRRML